MLRAIHSLRNLIQNVSVLNHNDGDGRKMTIMNDNSENSDDSDNDDDMLSSRRSGPVSNAFE